MSRRRLLKWAGLGAGAVVVAAAGGTLYRAYDQGVFSTGRGAAFGPWYNWRPDGGGQPEALVGTAILAANPHNTQPWLFRPGPDRIDLRGDPRRRTGANDPIDRELWIGLGCAVENLVLAAAAAGRVAEAALVPDPTNPWLAARVRLAPGPSAGHPLGRALYATIPHRRTNRGPYDRSRRVSPEDFGALDALGDDPVVSLRWFATEPERLRLGELTVRAIEASIADRAQSEAAFAWYRGTWREVQSSRHGLNLDGQALPPLLAALAKILPPASRERGDQFWVQSSRDTQIPTAAAFGLILVRQSAPAHWLRAGRLWQHLHLWGTAHGLAMQPLDQAPIRAEREASLGLEPSFGPALAELVSDPGWHAALPFRLGYPTVRVPPSPRRNVRDVLQ
jgi:hypothetical protein